MRKRRPSAGSVRLRGRIWMEFNGVAALTEPGADLLQQIQACGSLSEAARRLGFSYRRAWMLIESMNKRWPMPLVDKATGGRRGGGSTLTELGRSVLGAYRDAQLHLETLFDRHNQHVRALIGPVL